MKRVDAEILTVDDLAKLFACDKETAAARLTSGDLPGVKVGRGWIIPRQALFERLNEKARDESAARRFQKKNEFEIAQKRTELIPVNEENIKKTQSQDQFYVKNPNQRGRKRREPPILPNIKDYTKINSPINNI